MEIFMLWNTKTKSHTLYIPQQVVSGAHVTFGWELPEDCVLMFELHSHHTMGITFSSTDDTNDSSLDILPHISCVLKNIDKMNFLKLNHHLSCTKPLHDLKIIHLIYPLKISQHQLLQ